MVTGLAGLYAESLNNPGTYKWAFPLLMLSILNYFSVALVVPHAWEWNGLAFSVFSMFLAFVCTIVYAFMNCILMEKEEADEDAKDDLDLDSQQKISYFSKRIHIRRGRRLRQC